MTKFKPFQQSRQQALRAYCPNIYTVHTGYAKPSVSQGLRALIDVEAYESAGTSMAANGLVVSVNNVFDRALPTFNGIYISPGSYLCSTKTFCDNYLSLNELSWVSTQGLP